MVTKFDTNEAVPHLILIVTTLSKEDTRAPCRYSANGNFLNRVWYSEDPPADGRTYGFWYWYSY